MPQPSDRVVRIGGGCAFYGDSSTAPPQLIAAGVDYLALDYLAEATMSVLGQMRARRDTLGYAMDFTEWVWKQNLRALKQTGTRVITNAGGVNPHECARRMAAIAKDQGIDMRIAVVDGDDVRSLLDELAAASTREMFSGAPFPDTKSVLTANAYFGATPIARALALGADAVVTGRVVDSALALGPLMHEFGWSAHDYDLLAAGSLAGHVIECGAQATGGLFTDWEEVPDWAHIGYPIAECAADGSFVISKPEGTGGLVTEATIAEQILYEIGDPQEYLLPDVACDFTQVNVREVGANRVQVTGAIGRPPTGSYKVSITWTDGWRCMGFIPVVGRDAARKAERQAQAVLARVNELLAGHEVPPFRTHRIEVIGAETTYGAQSRARDTREVIYKLAVEHTDREAFRVFLREFDSPMTSMAVGSTGWFGGRAQVNPVVRVFSTTIDRARVPASVHFADLAEEVDVPAPPKCFDAREVERPPEGPSPTVGPDSVSVPLIELAWARSGDKGDAFNVGVIARDPRYLPYIRAALSTKVVRDWFAHEFEGAARPEVLRFELPGLNALNFVCSEALGGGQFASLRLDPLAKGKAQQLLEHPVPIPRDLLGRG